MSVRVFQGEISIELMDSVREIALPSGLGIIQPTQGLNGAKGRGRKDLPVFSCLSSLLMCLISSFPALRLKLSDLDYSTIFPGSPIIDST